MGRLTLLSPGLLTTVQDLGRPGYSHLGISPCGAADPVSLRLGNALAGNPASAAALEMTLVGPSLRFETTARFVLMGADMQATLDGNPIPIGEPVEAQPGEVFKTAAAREGCRCYLCIAGGFNVPLFLNSASTHLESRLGGIDGRRLQAGDRLQFHAPKRSPKTRELPAGFRQLLTSSQKIRVTDAIHTSAFSPETLAQFYAADYRISERSNRLGLRLDGPTLQTPGDVLTTGVCLGTIQITPSGQPIILSVDQQTTGGYPQIACIASVDHHRIGQLRPGAPISFEHITFENARKLYLKQEKFLAQLA